MALTSLSAVLVFILFWTGPSQAEIYQWLDTKGRIQFSDTLPRSLNSSLHPSADGYIPSTTYIHKKKTNPTSVAKRVKDLENIATELKKDRLKREKIRVNELGEKARKNKIRKQQLALAKKRQLACDQARVKENLAFRQRTQRHSLSNMGKALANYERKRQALREKCY
ncbi:MAG: DUF4124 domain-containing protein [Oleispira sp.]|nr:DUF4124 domain-containing protein [Oleispira sp.]